MNAHTPVLNISQSIVDDLGRRIVQGDFVAPGQKLLEHEIMEQYGASRNAVREAVKTLAGKNIIRSERRVGTIVQPLEMWNLLDPTVLQWMLSAPDSQARLLDHMSELRRIIEPEAAALAAQRATARHILNIYDCYDRMCESAHNAHIAVQHDVAFHEAILDACGNPLLRSLGQSIALLLRTNFIMTIQIEDAFAHGLVEHRHIADAIRDRNPEAARLASSSLLAKNEHDLKLFQSIAKEEI